MGMKVSELKSNSHCDNREEPGGGGTLVAHEF